MQNSKWKVCNLTVPAVVVKVSGALMYYTCETSVNFSQTVPPGQLSRHPSVSQNLRAGVPPPPPLVTPPWLGRREAPSYSLTTQFAKYHQREKTGSSHNHEPYTCKPVI